MAQLEIVTKVPIKENEQVNINKRGRPRTLTDEEYVKRKRESSSKCSREWYQGNKAHCRDVRKEWYQENKERIKAQRKARREKKNAETSKI